MRRLTRLLLPAVALLSAFCPAARTTSAPQGPESQTVIVVVGAGGAEQYGDQFANWAGLWEKACSKGGAKFIGIGIDNLEAQSDRAMLQKALADESGQTDSALWLILIGHGTFDGRAAKFNLRGPDLSADDLAEWLAPISRPTAVINSASSSAPFLTKLSAPGRVVITATKSGFEQNYASFAGYISQAIIDPQADLDKDGQTSLLEAFLTASHRTSEFYSSAGRLATEHALLDDNGDGLGTRADWFRGIRPVQSAADLPRSAGPGTAGGADLDGYRAGQFHLVRSDADMKIPPALRAERDRLELEVMELRDAKDTFPEEQYFSKLESILIRIAQIYEQAGNAPENPRQ